MDAEVLCCGLAWRSTKNSLPPLLAIVLCLIGIWSWKVGTLYGGQEHFFPYKSLSPAVNQNISCLMNVSVSCEFVFCLTVTAVWSLLCHWQLWLLNQILVIAPRSTPARLSACSAFALNASMEPESSPLSSNTSVFWRQDFHSKEEL